MLLKRADLAKTDIYLALLDHHNTPTKEINLSPVQRLFSHRTHTLLPMSTKLLKPDHHPGIKDKLISAQDRQASFYNKISQSLPEIQPGNVVRLKLTSSLKHCAQARLH